VGRARRLAAIAAAALIQGCALWGSELPVLANGSSIGYTRPKLAGVWAHVVTVNLKDPEIRIGVALAGGGPGKSEEFSSIVRRTRPQAAITGTYFNLRTFAPVGDLVAEGRPVFTGRVGNALAVAPGNRVAILHGKCSGTSDWKGYEAVLCGGPTLVRSGRIWVNPSGQGFRDRGHYRPRPRTAVGLKANQKLLMVVVTRPVTLSHLARVMRALGAVDAIALDGGTSAALHYKGRTIVRPGRRLTNVLLVYSGLPQSTHIATADSSKQPELFCGCDGEA
jgi:exopolysaccharide biosynthesis protein